MGRYTFPAFNRAPTPRYVVVWDLHWHALECQRLESAADLSEAMAAAIERLESEGWQAEATPEYGFVFIRREAERRLLMLTPRDPSSTANVRATKMKAAGESLNPFRSRALGEGPRRAEKGARVLFLSSHCCSPLASASPGLDDTGVVVEWRQRAFAQARRVSQSATRYVTCGRAPYSMNRRRCISLGDRSLIDLTGAA